MDYKILNELIDNVDKYKAHKKPKNEKDKKGEQIYETLLEHIKRTEKYFAKFWITKNGDEILERFCNLMLKDKLKNDEQIENAKKILKEMIKGIAIFHDIGKVNPNYQVIKIGNKEISRNEAFIDANHSFISSISYLSYFRSKLMKEVSKKKIRDLMK